MGLTDKLKGKVNELKEQRTQRHEIKDLEKRTYKHNYQYNAQAEAIEKAEHRAEINAHNKVNAPGIGQRLLGAGKKVVDTSIKYRNDGSKLRTRQAPRSYIKTRSQPRQKIMYIQAPTQQRKFVEIGDRREESALSSPLSDAFSFKESGHKTDSLLGGGIRSVFETKKRRR